MHRGSPQAGGWAPAWRGLVPTLVALTLVGSGCLGRLQPRDRRDFAERLATRKDVRRAPAGAVWGPALAGTDPRLVFIGRADETAADAAGLATARSLVWPGSEVRIRFHGTSLALALRSVGEVHLDVEVDGRPHLLSPTPGGEARYALSGLSAGWHRLRLVKRTEAAAGVAALLAVYPEPGGHVAPATSPPVRRLEFLGDSMTVGACAFDDGAEVWTRRESHDHRASFAARVADRLRAQHQAIAVSGLGVSLSLAGLRAEEIFDRLRPERDSPQAPATPAPDAVVVLLGHNDVLAARRAGRAFPQQFTADYVRLIRAIRRRYPTSWIVCTTGGMFHSVHSCRLRRAWSDAVRHLRETDARIVGHRFSAWSYLHPRAHTHARLADELSPLLARLLGWSIPANDEDSDEKTAH